MRQGELPPSAHLLGVAAIDVVVVHDSAPLWIVRIIVCLMLFQRVTWTVLPQWGQGAWRLPAKLIPAGMGKDREDPLHRLVVVFMDLSNHYLPAVSRLTS